MTDKILKMLDPEILSLDKCQNEAYAKDWSEAPAMTPDVVLRPRNAQDISAILELCQNHNQALVVQGGRTGLSGGATPQKKEWVLSLDRLDKILEINPDTLTITVQSGVVLERIQDAVKAHSLVFPVDIGARGSCMAGGIAATNAGGNQVIKYGTARDNILGLEAVLPDGTILSARNELIKNNAGFDLKQLLIGSEGVLGVITELTFRLYPERPVKQTALCGFSDFEAVTSFLAFAQRNILAVSAFELMWQNYFEAGVKIAGLCRPFDEDYPFLVLLEAEFPSPTDSLNDTLGSAIEKRILQNCIISQSISDSQNLWAIREAISELVTQLSPVVNFDIGIPIAEIDGFTQSVQTALSARFKNPTCLFFGHLGDSNLHIIVPIDDPEDQHEIESIVFALTRETSGTITAEHGIGRLKLEWLSYSRSPEEIELMRKLKRMLDPANILNPDRVISIESKLFP